MTGFEPALYGFAIRCVTIPPHPQIGLGGRIRTYGLLVPNQALYQTKLHRVGRCAGSRTPACGFGDRRATVTLHTHKMVLPAGLEPATDPL